MADTVRLKKYANRRLYDTERSTYITLNEVAELIRQGRQVEVYDAKTKEDVTAFILTQIVLEEARNKNALLPSPLLHLIIRYGDNLLGEFFDNYLQQTIQTYVAHKQALDTQFRQWLEMGMDLSQMAQKTMGNLNPFQSVFKTFATGKKTEDEENPTEKS